MTAVRAWQPPADDGAPLELVRFVLFAPDAHATFQERLTQS